MSSKHHACAACSARNALDECKSLQRGFKDANITHMYDLTCVPEDATTLLVAAVDTLSNSILHPSLAGVVSSYSRHSVNIRPRLLVRKSRRPNYGARTWPWGWK